MSKLALSGDALAGASVLGAFLLNAKNARRGTVDSRAERDAGGGGGGGGHVSAESTASSAPSSAQTSAVMNAKEIMLDYENYFTILLAGISGIFVNNLPFSS